MEYHHLTCGVLFNDLQIGKFTIGSSPNQIPPLLSFLSVASDISVAVDIRDLSASMHSVVHPWTDCCIAPSHVRTSFGYS